MKNKTQLFISVASLIVVFDVAASFASRLLRFDYASLYAGDIMLYMAGGYLGFQYHQLVGGFLAGLMAGLADSTVGWAISVAIHPFVRYPQPRTIFTVSVTIVLVTIVGGYFGFAGALIAKGISLVRAEH